MFAAGSGGCRWLYTNPKK